jgi:hypothetical protein
MLLAGSADRALAQSYLLGWRGVLNQELKRRGYANADSISDLAPKQAYSFWNSAA